MADPTEQVRRLRNKALRGAQERDAAGAVTALNQMTPAELSRFRDDLIYLTTITAVALSERERQSVRVGAEEQGDPRARTTGSKPTGGEPRD